jgi:hypothetical protein
MVTHVQVRDRGWQWRRGFSDALTLGLLSFGVGGAATGLNVSGDWWRWLLTALVSALAAAVVMLVWLRTAVSLDGALLTVRNPVGEVVAVTVKRAIGRHQYLALVRQSTAGRNSLVPVAALSTASARDPEVQSRLPFLRDLVERSFL